MKMRTYLGNRRQAIHKFLRNNPGLQRPQPDPLNPIHLSDFTHQIQQISPLHSRPAQILSIFQIIAIRLINKIHTIGTDMNSRKHNLLIPLPGKPPDLLQDILLLPAAHPPPGIRNDTIGTELITAVLDFDIRPGTLGRSPILLIPPRKRHFLISLLPGNIHHRRMMKRLHIRSSIPARLSPIPLTLLKKSLQNRQKILLPVIPHSQVNTPVQQSLFLPRLHITPHSNHHRIRVPLLRPMQHLPALPIRNISHSTRIYDIYICFIIKWYNHISAFL